MPQLKLDMEELLEMRVLNSLKIMKEKFLKNILNEFLKYADITIDEFHNICDSFTNKEIFVTNNDGSISKDPDNNPILKQKIGQ